LKDTLGYQNTFSSQTNQQSKSSSDTSKDQHDLSFESWLNDEPMARASAKNNSSSTNRSSTSKKTSHNNANASSKTKKEVKSVPAGNLINFDDDNNWTNNDAGWESIDTK
jgi:hypothetical protein